jgi:hypothetical protein
MYLGSFLLDPEDVKGLSFGPSGTVVKGQGSLDLASDFGAQRARLKVQAHRDRKGSNLITNLNLNLNLFLQSSRYTLDFKFSPCSECCVFSAE